MIRVERPGLRLRHQPGWLQEQGIDTLALRHQLAEALPWQQPEVTVYGKRHRTPRLTCWVADPGITYRYSDLIQNVTAWTPELRDLRDRDVVDVDLLLADEIQQQVERPFVMFQMEF